MKTHPFKSMEDVHPVRLQAGELFVGPHRVFRINERPGMRLRKGAKAAGFVNGQPVFLCYSFYTPTPPGYRPARRRSSLDYWQNWDGRGSIGDSDWEEMMGGGHCGLWETL